MCCIIVHIGQPRSQSLTPSFHQEYERLGTSYSCLSIVSELIDQVQYDIEHSTEADCNCILPTKRKKKEIYVIS